MSSCFLPVCLFAATALSLSTARGQSGSRATTPSDSNAASPFTQLCQQRLDQAKGKPIDLLFIGDIYTHLWAREGINVWKDHFGGTALNFGVTADGTQNILWRIDNMDLSGFSPKIAVINAGTNNSAQDTAEEVAAGIKAVIAKTHEKFPGANIILVSVEPSGVQGKYDAINDIIRKDADNKTVFFLDLTPLLPATGNTWTGIGADRFTPTAQFYEIWAQAMDPLLKKLLNPSAEPAKTPVRNPGKK